MRASAVLGSYPVSGAARGFYARALRHPSRAVRLSALRNAQLYYRALSALLEPLLSPLEPELLRIEALDVLSSLGLLSGVGHQPLEAEGPRFEIHRLAWQILSKRDRGLDFSEEATALCSRPSNKEIGY